MAQLVELLISLMCLLNINHQLNLIAEQKELNEPVFCAREKEKELQPTVGCTLADIKSNVSLYCVLRASYLGCNNLKC